MIRRMKSLGLAIVIAGIVLVGVGLVILLAGKIPFLGQLPGDLSLRGRNWSFSFPVMTCIVLSLVLTLVINLIFRLMNK
jgi:hypothetical protein